MDEKYKLETEPKDFIKKGIPESVEIFERNYLKKHPNLVDCGHNIYHIVSEDLDGNVVDECFGMNVLTDQGFYDMYNHNNDYNIKRISGMYLGDGEFETLDPASKTMVHAISTTSANITDYSTTHEYTQWIPEKASNKVVWRLCIGWFDYTVWSEDKTVTEIGLSDYQHTSPDYLKYHAAIYDVEGNKSSFVKKVNQKLTITVWGRSYIPISKIVNQMWDKGLRGAIRSNAMFQQTWSDYWYSFSACYFPYNWCFQSTYSSGNLKRYDSGSITDHVYSSQNTLGMNLFMDGRYQYISDLVIGTRGGGSVDSLYDQYWLFATKIRTPDPIPFRMEFYRNTSYKSLSLRHTYCRRNRDSMRDNYGQLPMSNIHISSLTMYNGQTDEWDIDVPFLEPTQYLEAGYEHLRYSIREHNYITFQNKYEWYTVYINEAPEYPIQQIYDFNKTMYVTDTYWDSSTWEIVPNTSNISREQGSKRFFIMFEDEIGDYWSVDDYNVGYYGSRYHTRRISRYDYDDKFPEFNLNNGYGEDHVDFGARNVNNGYYSYVYGAWTYNGKSVANDTLGYIAQDGFLVFPDSVDPNPSWQYQDTPTHSENLPGIPYRYNIGGVDLPDGFLTGRGYDGTYPGMIWNTTRGTHVVNFGVNSYLKGCRVYTMTDDPTTLPTYENFIFDQQFSDIPVMSHSDNGYLVIGWASGANNVNCTYVLGYDVMDQTPTMYKVEGYHHAFAIDLTNYFVAIDASVIDHLHMVIYDMANQTVYDEFDIPEGYTFQGIAGWKNFIYIRVEQGGAYSTYVYYMQNHILELTPVNIPQMRWDTHSWNSHIQRAVPSNGNIESCMVLLASDRDMNNENHVLFKESDPTNPIQLIRNETYETSNYIRWQKAWMGYTSDNKKLILTYSARNVITLDISWILRHGTVNQHFTYADAYSGSNDNNSPIYYKGYIYLMQMYRYESIVGVLGYQSYVYSSRCRYWRQPYQQHIDLCIEGTTYTPNSMMNPVRIQGNIASAYFSSTNRGVDDQTESES